MGEALANGDQPLVTVVVSCYSHLRFAKEAFDSVLAQTAYSKIKFIIYDNGSSPTYQQFINEYAQEHGIEIFREEKNLYGLGFRIHFLPLIKTPYAAFLHDDDYFHPEKIALSLERLQAEDLDFVCTNTNIVDSNSKDIDNDEEFNMVPMRRHEPIGSLLHDMFAVGSRLHFSTLVIRTSLAKETALGDPYYARIADAYFWKQLLVKAGVRFEVLPENLTAVRAHEKNDRRYTPTRDDKRREMFIVAHSVAELFRQILRETEHGALRDLLQRMHKMNPRPTKDLVEDLVFVSVELERQTGWVSSPGMALAAMHMAYRLDPVRSAKLIEEIRGQDGNRYMAGLHNLHHHLHRIYFPKPAPFVFRVIWIILSNPVVAWERTLFRLNLTKIPQNEAVSGGPNHS